MPALADQFQAYVQTLTGHALAWVHDQGPALPAYLSQRFEPRCLNVAGQTWLAALLKGAEPEAPLQLHKHLQQLQERYAPWVGGTCLVAEQLPPQLRRRLIELGQAFAIPGRQLFWPSLGSMETAQRPRRLSPTPVTELTPVAQQLLIALLLRRLSPPINISDAAEVLGYTAASVSQAVKVLEGSGLAESVRRSRERSFALANGPRETWKRALPLMGSPVRRRLRFMRDELPASGLLLAGEWALAEDSHLAAPEEPCFAVASRDWELGRASEIPTQDAGTCLVELWRYAPEPLAQRGRVDSLSLYLSLREHPDERVQIALEELLERVPW
jgi:DNA-binding transcriptional ArsR family regulator